MIFFTSVIVKYMKNTLSILRNLVIANKFCQSLGPSKISLRKLEITLAYVLLKKDK